MKVRTEFRLLMMTHNLTKAYRHRIAPSEPKTAPICVTTAFTAGTPPTAYQPASPIAKAENL